MANGSELSQAIGRLRRSIPRNVDAMFVCDAAEQAMKNPQVKKSNDLRSYWRDRQRAHRAKKK